MTNVSGDDRNLLNEHAPYLQYDAQEGYRAVSAATMTDALCNCLARADKSPIAGHGTLQELSLQTLANYPGSLRFEKGDHLASGPNPLSDAVRMQAEKDKYPHCAHGRAVRRAGSTWLEYWLWYYDNPKTFLGKGRHQGDWEMVIVELDANGKPKSVTCSQHNAGEARAWNAVEKRGAHPVVYVAPFSHANYFEARTYFYFPGADHPTKSGPCLPPEVIEFGPWQKWPGSWGASRGPFGGKFNIGGTSPEAPICQAQRWTRPNRYHAAAVARKPVAWLWRVLWHIGKASFPLAPKLGEPTLKGTKVTVEYELQESGLHRSRHLLLSVHSGDEIEAMLLSQTIRGASKSGKQILELPRSAESCVIYASAFNALGQRSDPVRVDTDQEAKQ